MADQEAHDVDAALAEQTRFANEAAQRVKDSIDPYPFALELLGHVFRGALTAGAMGGSEPRTIGFMHDMVGSILADDDPASLPVFEGTSR
jgi:hypothetical protein